MVNRYGCPENIGHACVYFGPDESAYVTGQIITVDGGVNSHAPHCGPVPGHGLPHLVKS